MTKIIKYIFSSNESKKKTLINKSIEELKLDENKYGQILTIINELENSKDGSVIAVNGRQGSGKSTVIDVAIKIYKKIHIFSHLKKTISINIWNLFGHRNKVDYKPEVKTAFVEISNKDNLSAKVRSVDRNDQEVSRLYIKKTIWKAIYSQMNIFNDRRFANVYGRNPLKHDYLASRKESISKLSWVGFLIVMLSIPSVLLTIFLTVLKNEHDAYKYSVPIIAFAFELLLWQIKTTSKNRWSSNNILVNQISNQAINRYITRKTRFFKRVIHVTELDRFSKWLSNDAASKESVNAIIETLTLLYKSKKMNIVIEIDDGIYETIKNSIKHDDIARKIFSETVVVRTFDTSAIEGYLSGIGHKDINRNVVQTIINAIHNSYMDKKYDSWRYIKEVVAVYETVIKNKAYSETCISTLKGHQLYVNGVISDIFESKINFDPSFNWINEGKDFSSASLGGEYWNYYMWSAFSELPFYDYGVLNNSSGNQPKNIMQVVIDASHIQKIKADTWPLVSCLYHSTRNEFTSVIENCISINNISKATLSVSNTRVKLIDRLLSGAIIDKDNIADLFLACEDAEVERLLSNKAIVSLLNASSKDISLHKVTLKIKYIMNGVDVGFSLNEISKLEKNQLLKLSNYKVFRDKINAERKLIKVYNKKVHNKNSVAKIK